MTSGHLTVIMGPMFSGKTSKLCFELNRYSDIGLNVLYINSKRDIRNDSDMSTHASGTSLSSKIIKVKINECTDNALASRGLCILDYDVIGIDEASFFPSLDDVLQWVDIYKKIVIVSGLDNDFKRELFGHVVTLSRHADVVHKLNAHCHLCLEEKKVVDAPFSLRIVESEEKVLAGGKDAYLAVCRKHWCERMK